MTMMIQTTRKQIGSLVAFSGKSAQVRTGMNQGQAEPLGGSTSLARHLSLSDPDTSRPRPERAYAGARRAYRRAVVGCDVDPFVPVVEVLADVVAAADDRPAEGSAAI